MGMAVSMMDLAGMARDQATAVDHRTVKTSWLLAAAKLSVSPLASWMASGLSERATRLQRSAIWFKGACAELQEHPRSTELDPDDSLRAELDGLASLMEKLAGEAAETADQLVKADGRSRGQVRDAFRAVAAAAQALRSEARDFASAVRAHDANVWAIASAKAGAARVLRSAEDVDAALSQALH